MSGKEAAEILEKVGIVCNKQMIPYDTEKPSVSSGIRLGSPALTTQGLGKKEFREVAEMIDLTLSGSSNLETIKSRVSYLTKKFLLFKFNKAITKE